MKPLLCMLFVVSLACVGTETGNPPLQPDLDPERVELIEGGAGLLIVQGSAGAVDPGGVDIQTTIFGSTDAPVRIPTNEDGSFRFELPGALTVRLQAINERLRSDVFDFSVVVGALSGVCRPTVPETFMRIEGEPGEETAIRFPAQPVCAEMLMAPALVRGDQGLSVTGMSAGDGGLDVIVTFDGRDGEVEDLLEVRGSEDAVFITLVAEACAGGCPL